MTTYVSRKNWDKYSKGLGELRRRQSGGEFDITNKGRKRNFQVSDAGDKKWTYRDPSKKRWGSRNFTKPVASYMDMAWDGNDWVETGEEKSKWEKVKVTDSKSRLKGKTVWIHQGFAEGAKLSNLDPDADYTDSERERYGKLLKEMEMRAFDERRGRGSGWGARRYKSRRTQGTEESREYFNSIARTDRSFNKEMRYTSANELQSKLGAMETRIESRRQRSVEIAEEQAAAEAELLKMKNFRLQQESDLIRQTRKEQRTIGSYGGINVGAITGQTPGARRSSARQSPRKFKKSRGLSLRIGY